LHARPELGEEFLAELLIVHLAAFELDVGLDLMALFDKVPSVTDLELEIVRVGPRMKADFLQQLLVGRFLRLFFALLLFVFPFAELDDLADRRLGIWNDLDQVLLFGAREFHRVFGRHDADHLAVVADDANFGGADLLVHADARIAGREHAAEALHAPGAGRFGSQDRSRTGGFRYGPCRPGSGAGRGRTSGRRVALFKRHAADRNGRRGGFRRRTGRT